MNQIDLNGKLKRFVVESGANFGRLSEAFGETQANLWRWLNGSGAVHLGLRQLENLALYLGVSAEELMKETWPIESWRSKVIEGPLYINEKYLVDAHSKVRSSAHINRFLAMRFGRARADSLLRKLGVHPSIYSMLDNRLSIDFFVDLLKIACEFGLPKSEIANLGCYMFLGLKNTPLAAEFSKAKSYFESYEVLGRSASRFDENFEYDLKVEPEGFVLKASPADHVKQRLKDHLLEFALLAEYRRTMMGWFSYLSGLAPLQTQMPRSVAYGDSYCEIRGQFPAENQARVRLIT